MSWKGKGDAVSWPERAVFKILIQIRNNIEYVTWTAWTRSSLLSWWRRFWEIFLFCFILLLFLLLLFSFLRSIPGLLSFRSRTVGLPITPTLPPWRRLRPTTIRRSAVGGGTTCLIAFRGGRSPSFSFWGVTAGVGAVSAGFGAVSAGFWGVLASVWTATARFWASILSPWAMPPKIALWLIWLLEDIPSSNAESHVWSGKKINRNEFVSFSYSKTLWSFKKW